MEEEFQGVCPTIHSVANLGLYRILCLMKPRNLFGANEKKQARFIVLI